MSATIRKAVVVSIHDVSPVTRDLTEEALASLASDGVQRCSLLVIPDHHGRGHFADDRSFCDWLSACVRAGHEVVVHGFYHQRPQRAGETLRERLITRLYTAGEGEFFDLGREAASQLLERARGAFVGCGFHPTGFIAPAWLLGMEAEAAVRSAGFAYTTRLRDVLRFADGRRWESQSLVWSVRSGWRRAVSERWNAWLFARLRKNPLLRVSVHPPDLRFPAIWKQAKRLIRQALEEREAITYERWVHIADPITDHQLGGDFRV